MIKTTEYRKLSFGQVCTELAQPKNTLILFHVRPDGDAVGSAFALKLVLEAAGSKVFCMCQNEVPQRLSFLSEGIQKSALPEAMPADFEVERVVAVDTASVAQLGDLYARFEGKIDIKLDHHSKGEQYSDYFVMTNAAATGEIIFDISRDFLRRGVIKVLPGKLDFCLYTAISSDTGCFKYSNVTPKTHIRTAELLKSGIDTARINQLLFDSKSMEVLAAEKAGFDTLKMFHNRKIAVVFFTYDMKQKLGIMDEHLETLIDVARSVEGVEVAIAIRQPTAEKAFRVSTRSMGYVDVSEVCSAFGGGGHLRASGCTIVADSIEHAADLVVMETEKQMR
jgi:phosphoesterase RecJ-like protein